MKWMLLARTAKMVVEVAAGVQPHEQVCVVADTKTEPIAAAIASACYAVGAETVVCLMTPRKMHGNEPPTVVAAAMAAADVVIAPTTYALTHTDGRIKATQAGTRIVILREITEDTFLNGAIGADYQQVFELTKRLAARVSRANTIRMTAPGGSDVRLSIEGRQAIYLGGLARGKGSLSSLPSGEAAIVPVEGTTEGVLVVDHAIDGLGKLSAPVKLTIEQGRVTRIEGGHDAERLRRIVESAGENATNIAEFAIGTNPLSRLLGNIAEDKVLRGSIHMAIGDSHTIGGTVSSDIHLDHVVLRPTVWLDDEVIVRDGALLGF